MKFRIREATPDDTLATARILHDSYNEVATEHGFPPAFATVAAAMMLTGAQLNDPLVYAVVAESDERIIGCGFLDERDPIRGLGPLAVERDVQCEGVGFCLASELVARARKGPGVRGVGDATNMASVRLYAKLGFCAVEPLLLIEGEPRDQPPDTIEFRGLDWSEVQTCGELCLRMSGFPRTNAIKNILRIPICVPCTTYRDGELVAYFTSPSLWQLNHGVAASDDDFTALVLGAAVASGGRIGFLLPARRTDLLRWCVNQGLFPVRPFTLYVQGEYKAPAGLYVPSAVY